MKTKLDKDIDFLHAKESQVQQEQAEARANGKDYGSLIMKEADYRLERMALQNKRRLEREHLNTFTGRHFR